MNYCSTLRWSQIKWTILVLFHVKYCLSLAIALVQEETCAAEYKPDIKIIELIFDTWYLLILNVVNRQLRSLNYWFN